jgi:hypothetical protein
MKKGFGGALKGKWKTTKTGDMDYYGLSKNDSISIEKYSDKTADVVFYYKKGDRVFFDVLKEDVPISKAKEIAQDFIKSYGKKKLRSVL